jgi:hypothetical protein
MATESESGEAVLPEQDEVTGRVAGEVRDVASLIVDWVRRAWAGRCGTDWVVAWYAFLLTALTALVVSLVSSIPMWLMQPRFYDAERPFPLGRWLLHTFVDAPWRGAFLGLGLVVFDRIAGGWRRPVRWAAAGAVVPGLLAVLLPQPTEWHYVYRAASADGFLEAMHLMLAGQPWLWLLVGAACGGAWGWWVGRAAIGPERLERKLTQAGAEAALVVSLLAGIVGLPSVLPMLRAQTMSWTDLWASSAFGLLFAGLKGALNGLAIAVALQATRPREPRVEPGHGA